MEFLGDLIGMKSNIVNESKWDSDDFCFSVVKIQFTNKQAVEIWLTYRTKHI